MSRVTSVFVIECFSVVLGSLLFFVANVIVIVVAVASVFSKGNTIRQTKLARHTTTKPEGNTTTTTQAKKNSD